ncbi:hypothetical protein OROGR_023584 [Orobanche gracilis]
MVVLLLDFEHEMATTETATTSVKKKWQWRPLNEEISGGGGTSVKHELRLRSTATIRCGWLRAGVEV